MATKKNSIIQDKKSYTMFAGNPSVQARKVGDTLILNLVYNLGTQLVTDKEGNEVARSVRKTKRMEVKGKPAFVYINPKNPKEREHNDSTLKEAEYARMNADRDLTSRMNGIPIEIDVERIDFLQWAEEYINKYLKADIRVVRLSLKRFRRFLAGSKKYSIFQNRLRPQQMTKEMMMDFVETLHGECKGEGARTLWGRWKKLVNAATDEGLFVKSPCHKIVIPKPESVLKKDVLTNDEIKQLIATKSDKQSEVIRRAFIFSLFTGMRFCDVKDLRYSNIDFKNKVLSFEQSKVKKKSSKSRVTQPLRDSLIELVGKGEPDELVFRLPSHTMCLKSIGRWVAAAGIDKHITWHCARHSFCTNLYMNTHDIKGTSELAGHSDIKTTEVYIKVADDTKKKMLETLPDVDFQIK